MNPQADYVWMDGKYVKWEEAKIHVSTQALHYGTGVFEGIRAYQTGNDLAVFRLKEHLKRLFESVKVYMLNCAYTTDQLEEATLELLRKNKIHSEAYIRPLIYTSKLGLDLETLKNPTSTVILAFPSESLFSKPGISVCVSSWRRIHESSTPPLAKASGNYINSVLAKIEASQKGYDDAILLDQNGLVSEAAGANLFLVDNGKLVTPQLASSVLEGITRDTVIQMARNEGLTVEEREVNRTELYTSDEVFLAGSAAEVKSVLEVDGRKVGSGQPGSVAQQLGGLYHKVVRGEIEQYKRWLFYVYR
jgi:branched-chain amino acid aminotransferase